MKKTTKTVKKVHAAEATLKPVVMLPKSYQPVSSRSTRAGVKQKESHQNIWKRYKRVWQTLILVPVILVLISGGWVGWKLFENASKAANGNAFGFLVASKLNGEDKGRVNILLAGNSADQVGHGGAKLTDSIMIASIDVQNHTAYMVSIPRDFYVKIPGYSGYHKINEAYVDGERDGFSEAGYADGGMGLLEKTLENTTGVHMDHYALVNYTAFRDAVNAVGGIDVNIQSSDPRGIFDPNLTNGQGIALKLTNGWHHLDGQQALDLSRARNDAVYDGRRPYGLPRGDYDRQANQQMMLVALKSKIFSSATFTNPLKVGNVLDSIGNNVKTDMTTGQIRRAYDLMKRTDNSAIKQVNLNDSKNGVTLIRGATIGGVSVQIPKAGQGDYTEIMAYFQTLNTSDSTSTKQ